MNPHNSKIEPLHYSKANNMFPRPIPRVGGHVFVSMRLHLGPAEIKEINEVDDHGILLTIDFDGVGDYAYWHNCWTPDEYLLATNTKQ